MNGRDRRRMAKFLATKSGQTTTQRGRNRSKPLSDEAKAASRRRRMEEQKKSAEKFIKFFGGA